jgi:hypothetical protein
MKHLSDEELIAALRAVDVPDPSPLFWDHLSERVREAVASEPTPSSGWASRFTFAWAAGVCGAIAVVVLAVAVTTHQARSVTSPKVPATAIDAVQAEGLLPALQDDPSLAVMGELTSQMDFDEAGAAGLIALPGSADSAIGLLSQDEQRAAVDLLRQEIKNAKRL